MPYGLFDYGGTIQTMGAADAGSPFDMFGDAGWDAGNPYHTLNDFLSRGWSTANPKDVIKIKADDTQQPSVPVTLMLGEDSKTPVYTRAIPEDPNVVKVRADDLPQVGTAAYPEDPSTPITMRAPEDPSDIYKIKADDAPPSGGCPKGYEPTSKNQPDGKQFYPANPYTLAIPE